MNKKLENIIVVMHKRLQNGLHRFTGLDVVNTAWSRFFKLLQRKPELQQYLDDKGNGDPGIEYNECVESCLRQFAFQKSVPFGVYAMESYRKWTETSYWKKREGYIAAVRAFKGLPSYNKYIGYNWEDYVFRVLVGKTFLNRHFQYSNGSCRLDIPDPHSWSLPRRKRGRKRKVQETSPSPSEGEDEEEGESGPTTNQEWDSEEGEFVDGGSSP